MAAWFLRLPVKSAARTDTDTVLTVVVPAPNGCNLKCPHCVLAQRGEQNYSPALSVDEYVAFTQAVVEQRKVDSISVQGEEPLLPESMPFTLAIQWEAQRVRVPFGLITNGIGLTQFAGELAGVSNLVVSIDATKSAKHDELRGVKGAYGATLKGLKEALKYQSLRDRISVASVLFPGKVRYLQGMPGMLATLGVRYWYLSPHVKIGRAGHIGGPSANREELSRSVGILLDEARNAGIKLCICDDFDQIPGVAEEYPDVFVKKLSDIELIRLIPSGGLVRGRNILMHQDSIPQEEQLVWNPKQESATDFCHRLWLL